jgi:hypothetical protein
MFLKTLGVKKKRGQSVDDIQWTCIVVAGDEHCRRNAALRCSSQLPDTWDVSRAVNSFWCWLVGRMRVKVAKNVVRCQYFERNRHTWIRLWMELCQTQPHLSTWQMTSDVCEIFLLLFLDMQMKQNGASCLYLIDFVAENQS